MENFSGERNLEIFFSNQSFIQPEGFFGLYVSLWKLLQFPSY